MEDLKIYIRLALGALRARMEYKTSFFFYIFSILFYYAAQVGLLLIVLTKFKTINGWGIGEIALLYGLLAFAQGFATLLFNPLNNFEEMIVKGEFDRFLVRPLSPMAQIICTKFEISTVASLIIGAIALGYGALHATIDWTLDKLISFPLMVGGAVLILGGIRILVASVAFWTLKNSSLVHTVVYSSKEFVVYPISIYNKAVQFFLTFVYPIAFINYYPAQYFLGQESSLLPMLQYLTPLVGIAIFIFSLSRWKSGIDHYQGTGS